jgi:hypothetical protein
MKFNGLLKRRLCGAKHSNGKKAASTSRQFRKPTLATMSSFRQELNNYLSIPGALCVVAGGWLYLAAQHCSEEARRVSQAYVLDSLSGASCI